MWLGNIISVYDIICRVQSGERKHPTQSAVRVSGKDVLQKKGLTRLDLKHRGTTRANSSRSLFQDNVTLIKLWSAGKVVGDTKISPFITL